jgi:hypothetical protein
MPIRHKLKGPSARVPPLVTDLVGYANDVSLRSSTLSSSTFPSFTSPGPATLRNGGGGLR